MSRNKDIKNLKSVSGCRYSYLRKTLKKHSWDYWKAYAEIQRTLILHTTSFSDLTDSFRKFGSTAEETKKAFENLKETLKPLKEKGVI